jgi:hypothetical protein
MEPYVCPKLTMTMKTNNECAKWKNNIWGNPNSVSNVVSHGLLRGFLCVCNLEELELLFGGLCISWCKSWFEICDLELHVMGGFFNLFCCLETCMCLYVGSVLSIAIWSWVSWRGFVCKILFCFVFFLMILRFGRIDPIMFFFVEWRLHDFIFVSCNLEKQKEWFQFYFLIERRLQNCFLLVWFGEVGRMTLNLFICWMKVVGISFFFTIWKSGRRNSKFVFCFLQFGKMEGIIPILFFLFNEICKILFIYCDLEILKNSFQFLFLLNEGCKK